MKEKNKKSNKKLFVGILLGVILITFVSGIPRVLFDSEDGEWVIEWEGSLTDLSKADYSGTGTFPLWICGLDSASDIDAFASWNRTHAQISVLGNVSFSADADSFSEECAHSDDFNFAVKVVANNSIYHDGDWNDSRIRVTLTVSGDLDQTISAVTESNNSGTAGDLNQCALDGVTRAYYVAYWTEGADDYDLDEGGTATISLIKVETYRTN